MLVVTGFVRSVRPAPDARNSMQGNPVCAGRPVRSRSGGMVL